MPTLVAPAKDNSRPISVHRGRDHVRHGVEGMWTRTAGDSAKDEPEPGHARLSPLARRAEQRIRDRRRNEPARGSGVVPFQRVIEPTNGLTRLTLVRILAAAGKASETGK